MKIKRYLDTDMRQVLRRVREDQGPDAVILSNRRVEDGIEVIAAVDYDEALIHHALGSQPAEQDVAARQADAIENTAVGETDTAQDDVELIGSDLVAHDDAGAQVAPPESTSPLHEVQREISSLRGLLETQLSALLWKDAARRSPLRAQVLRNLSRLGIAPDIAHIIVNRLEPINDIKRVWQVPLATLAQTIPVIADELPTHGGVAALIGPTGVGKTTTIAKIAARYAMLNGSDEIALVCADAYRIGAREHLMAFANIIGVKVHAASTSDELSEVLQSQKRKKLVLIDTEGMSQRDVDLSSRLAAYGGSDDRVRFYLTLSAASQEAGLDETVRRFSKVPLSGCIVTKIDEAAQLGCVISTLIRHNLPVAWLTDGQRIPDDLHAAERKKLWLVNQAVECMEASEPRIDERVMAENYSQASAVHA